MARRSGSGRIAARQGLSASRITQAHQLVGAVLKYAQRTGKIARNVAAEIKRPKITTAERERRYLNHAELSSCGATERFETLTLVLGYCGLRFGEAVALRRKHVGDRELPVRASATYVTGRGMWNRPPRQSVPPRSSPRAGMGSAARGAAERSERIGVPKPSRRALPIEEYRKAFDKAATLSGSLALYRTGYGTPRRHWRLAQALMSRSCKASGHATAAMTLTDTGTC